MKAQRTRDTQRDDASGGDDRDGGATEPDKEPLERSRRNPHDLEAADVQYMATTAHERGAKSLHQRSPAGTVKEAPNDYSGV